MVRVPDTLEELVSPAWLTGALGQSYPGIEVAAATLGSVESRISTNACFRIECDGGVPTGLPASLCAKGYFSDTGTAAYRSAGESEALFYRDLAATIGARTLPSVYADVDDASRHGVVITEDITVAGARFLDPLERYTSSRVAVSLEQYAVMHATTWKSAQVRSSEWLTSRISSTAGTRTVSDIQDQYDGPLGAGIPEGARDAEKLLAAYKALPGITDSATSWCLLHGDAHVGNLFEDRTGRPGLLDWQLVQRGPWYLDVGYHLASSMGVEDRRSAEHDLLTLYRDRLASKDLVAPSWDEVWFGICCGIVYGMFLWSITQKVKPQITTVLLERLGTAAADHDACDVVLAAGI